MDGVKVLVRLMFYPVNGFGSDCAAGATGAC